MTFGVTYHKTTLNSRIVSYRIVLAEMFKKTCRFQ